MSETAGDDPLQARRAFNRELKAVANPSAPSVTKFHPARDVLAEALGLPVDDVYVVYSSKAGNLNVRLGQSGGTERLGVAMVPDADGVEGQLDAARTRLRQGRNEVVALVARGDDDLQAARVAYADGSTLAPTVAQLLGDPTPEPVAVEGTLPSPGALAMAAVPLVFDDRLRRVLRNSVAAARAVLLVGPPGTGKTTLLEELVEQINADPARFGFAHSHEVAWETPDESWTARELVGGETVDDQGRLRFRPGKVLDAVRDDKWLILDEANRADLDKVFGPLLTWLAGRRSVVVGRTSGSAEGGPVTLAWATTAASRAVGVELLNSDDPGAAEVRFEAGTDWRLLGTYNALDAQRVFRFGLALGRRFAQVPVPAPAPEDLRASLAEDEHEVPQIGIDATVELYRAHLGHSGAVLGPAPFIQLLSYVAAGLRWLDEEPSANDVLSLLAEGYAVHLGTTWLARLEAGELDELGRLIVDSGALPVEEWEWVKRMVNSAGI